MGRVNERRSLLALTGNQHLGEMKGRTGNAPWRNVKGNLCSCKLPKKTLPSQTEFAKTHGGLGRRSPFPFGHPNVRI